jgi:hypothetical protein
MEYIFDFILILYFSYIFLHHISQFFSFLQVFRWTDMNALIGYFRDYANAPNKHAPWDIYREFYCFTLRD